MTGSRTRGAAETARAALLLALGTVAVSGALLWLAIQTDSSSSGVEGLPTHLPQLRVACAAKPDAARSRAKELERIALAKTARYPFAAEDGLPALHALTEAEDCYALAGAVAERAAVQARRDRLLVRLERDYRDHVTRYRHACEIGRGVPALSDLHFLLSLFRGEHAPWLAQLKHNQNELEALGQNEGSR
jgi:hypothetical protein